MFAYKKDKDKRFEVITEQTVNMVELTVVRDSQTGVNYLLGQGINGFAINALIDKEGNPLVTSTEEK